MSKSYRIRTQVGVDKHINVKLDQDFDFLEILSLKINQSDIYIRPCSDYGVIVGRISVNNGFGLPNAKVSVFIPLSSEDENNPIISDLYPYKSLSDVNEDGYRYNLLPKEQSYSTHAATGTFPTKEEILIDQTQIEIYDKYYKFTAKTNESGDYMIFGVPVGAQTVFMDVDLSDIGCFSLSPQDLIQAGLATETQVSGSKFKSSSNLNELPQIITSNRIIDVSPLWGEPNICSLGITRCDFDLTQSNNINIQPSSVFMGSIISTTDDDAISVKCKPKNNTGNLCELVAGGGSIQAIRQTIFLDQQNLPILEEYQLEQNGNVIDGDGSYLVNIPMNLDYVITNEFGEQVISNDPKKGIPTKGRYRFKFKWNNESGLQSQFLRANYLVPNIREYGWQSSNNDPLNPSNTSQFTYTISNGSVSGTTQSVPGTGGLVLENTSNVLDFNIYLNGVLYPGDPSIIPITSGNIRIVANPNDPNLPQVFNFTYYQSKYFDLLRSYTFSLDWDDYTHKETAINCEDTFYEFNYNKVYTTSMFLDRYKNGIGRARHLGIKEIDNRSCKTTTNTFPVNDIIRNFDFLFFIFNILLNVLSPVILVLLFVAHFISFLWPILKWVIIFISIKEAYEAVVAGIESIATAAQTINAGLGIFSANVGGPVFNAGWFAEALRLVAFGAFKIIVAAVKIGFSLTLAALAIIVALRVKGFPRLGLPMISYPECNNCDCNCKEVEMDDSATTQSVQENVDSNTNKPPTTLAKNNSFLAPINQYDTYDVEHPNLNNIQYCNTDDRTKGWFNIGPPFPPIDCEYTSLLFDLTEENINDNVPQQAVIDFKRMFSGFDELSQPYFNGFKAPQPFLFAASKTTTLFGPNNDDKRFFANPKNVSYPQKLNDFNTRDKFFSNVNKITTTINPQLGSDIINDNVIVLLANVGTTAQIGVGNVFALQNPNISNGQINITGATLNQFGTNAITGVTLSNPTPITIQVPIGNNTFKNVKIINSGATEGFMQYPPDIEYYQIITGLTVGNFESVANFSTNLFPKDYLKHKISYEILNIGNCDQILGIFTPNSPITASPLKVCDTDNPPPILEANNFTAIEKIGQYQTQYEVIILVRGVDPHTPKQNIKYDLSRIFGHTTSNTTIVEGSYYMNIPIQENNPTLPSHNTTDNSPTTKIYFKSFTFTPNTNNYTGFTSFNPYYYLSTDDSISSTYAPTQSNSYSINHFVLSPQLNTSLNQNLLLPINQSAYIGGASFIAINNQMTQPSFVWDGASKNDVGWAFDNDTNNMYRVYSPVYYKESLPGVNFNQSEYIVMRSDRLPTSSCVEDGPGDKTGYALHQNNNFCYFTADGSSSSAGNSFNSDLASGEQLDSDVTSLTETLTCESMVSLQCYQGSGTDVTVNENCSVPKDRVVQGCYCLLNSKNVDPNNDKVLYKFFKKVFLIKGAFTDDARLFLEWKTRFTITFAACRGIFAQVFQNNWINGTLYMFNFNKTAKYNDLLDTTPEYTYCKDVIIFNDLENNFYYRSSPWDGTKFIGKNPPQPSSSWPPSLINGYPGLGYNEKQIQFPTTIMDLGPREKFISEICNNDNFNGYYVDQLKSTSYQDNSILIQVGFLSRLLNDNFRQAMIPLSNPNGDNTEGKGIIQFFNSKRKADRIDGDFAQMLSINSEWRINPFLTENYPNPDSIFFGDDSQSGDGYPRPVFGVFYEGNDLDYVNRRRLTPGIDYYNITPPIFYQYGYPKTQEVPHYLWKLDGASDYIFGNENNNWDTSGSGGFFSKGYQDLDYNVDPYFKSPYNTQTQVGYITNIDSNGDPKPNKNDSTTKPGESILVGAPNHFYFGLNNGKTAIDKFVKLYIFDPNT
jgi:hypothetical protein